MKNFLKYLQSSFDTHSKGASARKLSAFWVVVLITMLHVWWLRHAYRKEDFSLLMSILTLDFGFVALALGLTTFETITKLKNKKDESNTPADNT